MNRLALASRRTLLAAGVVAALCIVASLVTACGDGAVGKLSELRAVAEACPRGKTVAGFISLSGSRNQRGSRLVAARMEAVKSVAETVAACGGGALKVALFGPSLASTTTVYDGQLHPEGATVNARLLRVPEMVDAAMAAIKARLPSAFKRLAPDGTDPLGQLQAARDFAFEQGPNVETDVLIETAGLAPQVHSTHLTSETAAQFASEVDVPELRSSNLTIAGLGHVGSGPPPSTTTVEGLIVFYRKICQRTGALSCRATSNTTVRG